VAVARDYVGGGIHDTVSKVPVIGDGLGSFVDFVGRGVDFAGGFAASTVSEVFHGFGCISNMVGAATVHAGYVDFDDISSLEEVSDEEYYKMSRTERDRYDGRGGIVGLGLNLAGFGHDMSNVDTSSLPLDDPPSWCTSMLRDYEYGEMDDDDLRSLVAAQGLGLIDDYGLSSLVDVENADGGQVDWKRAAFAARTALEVNGITPEEACASLMASHFGADVESTWIDDAKISGGARSVSERSYEEAIAQVPSHEAMPAFETPSTQYAVEAGV
jgi:hypothetical protein